MEEIYYKKILVTSGEVPEENGVYDTNKGKLGYHTKMKKWYFIGIREDVTPEWWLKPVPSPKQEAVLFAEWFTGKYELWGTNGKESLYGQINVSPYSKPYSLSELYDKFKEKGD